MRARLSNNELLLQTNLHDTSWLMLQMYGHSRQDDRFKQPCHKDAFLKSADTGA